MTEFDDVTPPPKPQAATVFDRQLLPDVKFEGQSSSSEATPQPPRFAGPHRDALKVGFRELEFEDVVMRVFPIAASLNRLTAFCKRYLNMDVPEEIAHFEPAAPYVLMMVINYGRMADSVSNMGWVSQNEILVAVPLVGKWNENGKTIQGPAMVSPFIFVDNAWSITTGREVYGWPKMPVWFEPGLNTWLEDPRSPRRLMTLKTLAMTEFYQGREPEAHTLFEIEQEPHQVFGQVPANFDYLLNPLIRLPRMVAHTMAAAPDFLQSLNRIARSGVAAELPSMVGEMFKGFLGSGPNLYGNTINLKQFRSSDPGTICYQSLVNSRMQIKRYNAGGLMGSVDLLRGDPNAGFSIFIHRLPAFPIVESLGLAVEREHDRDGVSVAELKPIMPFWASLDLSYKRGQRICWRTYDRSWRAWGVDDPTTDAVDADTTPDKPAQFNTTLGAVVEATQGPFDFFDTSIRVLPIAARSDNLRRLFPDLGDIDFPIRIASYETPVQDWARAEAVDPAENEGYDAFVFVVITSYGEMSSALNDIGWWAKNEVSIVVPVELGPVAWLSWPYTFSDSPVAVTEGREVLGLPTAYARISAGTDPWLQDKGPSLDRQLLSVDVMDYPAAGVGQKAFEQRILEVKRSDQPGTDIGRGLVASFKKSPEFDRYKKFGICIPNLSLKEFRDEEQPERPCYQAVVGFDRELGEWTESDPAESSDKLELEPLAGRYTVTFNRTPSWPIAEKLGLKHRKVRSKSGGPVSVCDVVEPFWVRANIRAHLSADMIHRRLDTTGWTEAPGHDPDEPGYLLSKTREAESWEKATSYLAQDLDPQVSDGTVDRIVDEPRSPVTNGGPAGSTPQLKDLQRDLYALIQRSRGFLESQRLRANELRDTDPADVDPTDPKSGGPPDPRGEGGA